MIDALPRRAVVGGVLFAVCFLILLILRLLPLSSGLTGWPGPDVGLCLALAWLLRRPEHLPVLMIAVLFLIEDIALYRPIGLWAAIVVLATESARAHDSRWREQPFLVEWMRVSVLIGLMMLGYRLVQVLLLLPVAALGQVILHYLATAATYPLVVLGARWLVGLRRSPPGSVEAKGWGR